MEIVKIALLIVFMILLIRKNMAIGVVLILSAMIVGFMFAESIIDLPVFFYRSMTSYIFFRILAIIYSVFLIASVLKAGDINKMLEGIVNLVPKLKIAMIIPPMTIGLLPMPGGAMLPAPIVGSIGNKLNMKPEHKVYVNFWFRHVWEYAWPLYPGLILTVSILKIEMKTIVMSQFYLSIIAIAAGLVFLFTVIKGRDQIREMHPARALLRFLSGIWPILIIIILILATPIPVEFLVLAVAFIYWMISKIQWRKKLRMLYNCITIQTIFLVVGLVLFKDFLQYSNALEQFVAAFPASDFLPLLLIIMLPLIVGFLTGINQGYVAIALPVLVPFLHTAGSVDMLKVAIFYASGFAGILLSPAHLCLSLTKEYFRADFNKVYKYLIPSTIPIFIIPIIIYLLRR